MADRVMLIQGTYVKLIDNGDGTWSIGAELTPSTSIIGKVIIDSESMVLYGASTATRPLATAVPVGTAFVVVDSATSALILYMTNGTTWVEVEI